MKKLTKSISGGMTYFRKKMRLTFREGKPWVYKIQVIRGNVIGKKDIIPYAAKAAHVPENDIEMAMNAFFDAIDYFCTNGHRVQVEGLGSFGVVTNSKTAHTLEECTTETIQKRRLRMYPAGDLRTMGSTITFNENEVMSSQACGLGIDGTDQQTNAVRDFKGKTAVFGGWVVEDGEWSQVPAGRFDPKSMVSVPTTWSVPGESGRAQYGVYTYTIANGVVS